MSSEQNDACYAARENAGNRNSSSCAERGFDGNTIEESYDYSGQVKSTIVNELQQRYMWEYTAHIVSRCATKLPEPKCTLSIAEYPNVFFM